MKELKNKLSELPFNYTYEVAFYEKTVIIVRINDKTFKQNEAFMIELTNIANLIKNKYNIHVIFSTLEYYNDLNFSVI